MLRYIYIFNYPRYKFDIYNNPGCYLWCVGNISFCRPGFLYQVLCQVLCEYICHCVYYHTDRVRGMQFFQAREVCYTIYTPVSLMLDPKNWGRDAFF